MLINVPIEHGSYLLRLHVRPLIRLLGTSTICSCVAIVILPVQSLYYTVTSSTCLHCQSNVFSPTGEHVSLVACRLMAWLDNDILFEAKLVDNN